MSKTTLFAAAFAANLSLASGSGWAGPEDYKFEMAEPPAAVGRETALKVRLVHVPDGKPVTGAVITKSRVDMAPAGMSTITAPVRPMPAAGGIYSFRAQTSMAGDWALHLSAKVQGEPATVSGSVTFKATR